MQAIRGLRAQSRPASPGPSLVEGNNVPTVNGARGPLQAQTLSSNSEDAQNQAPQRPTSAMSRIQSLTPFHKRVVFTPPPSPKPVQSAIVQDGAYLNTLGLKLNEAATRVLAPTSGTGTDSWKGKKPLQAGRGRQFATLVETELDASQGNTNLRHAILRLLPRSLTVIVSSLSTQVSQLTASPGYVPSTVMASPHPTTVHAVSLAVFAAEILETFHTYKLGTASPELAAIYGHLETIVARITSPLFAQLQIEMSTLLEPIGYPVGTGLTSSPGPPAKPGKPHAAVAVLTQYMPHFARSLKRCAIPSSPGTQKALATFLISTIWQALAQLSHRAPPPQTNSSTGTGSGTMGHKASVVSLALSQMSLTPPSSPPAMKRKLTPPSSPPSKKRGLTLPGTTDSPPRGMLRLRRVPSAGSTGSRSSSPERRASQLASAASTASAAASASSAWLSALLVDIKALGELLASPEVPRPVESSLAREAVDEAFERFVAFREWIRVAAAIAAAPDAGGNGATTTTATLLTLMDSAPEEVPLLILLPVLLGQAWLARSPPSSTSSILSSATSGEKDGDATTYPGIARLIGYESDETYRRGVLCGFRRADECEAVIARCLLGRIGVGAGARSGSVSVLGWAEGVGAWLAQRVAE